VTNKIVLSRQAERYYSTIDAKTARRLNKVFEVLESDSKPTGAKALKGELEGFWRVRVGYLRVVYQLNEMLQEIRIIRIGPRGDIY
jgi:mRNA interferase RelE/StbE